MSLFNFSEMEIYSFFAVLVRFSVLFSILPFIGDRLVPMPVKILLSLCVSITLFPALVSSGSVRPIEAARWATTPGGLVSTIGAEVIFALILGFTARLAFEAINFGGNLTGNFMGFAMASTFDPQQQAQTQVVAEIQMAVAMLLFLVLDGHHLMLRASLESYQVMGIGALSAPGRGGLNTVFSQRLIEISSQVLRVAIQVAAPVAICLFGVNVAFGVMAKAMPQLNILVLSVTVSGFVGLVIMFLTLPEFQSACTNALGKMNEWMQSMTWALALGK